MPRRLITLLTLLSAMLCAFSLLLWVSSYGTSLDHIEFGDPPHHLIMSDDGRVVFRSVPAGGVAGDAAGMTGWSVLGFGSYTMTYARGSHRSWEVPYWFLTLATAALPAWWLRRIRRE
jgi:hypothetical protein